MPATPGSTTRSPGRRTWCGCPVWWRSPISTKPRGAGIRTCTPTSSCPTAKPAPTGSLVSIDGTSLYHEARAAGVIYQATLRRELHQSLGLEWAPVDPATGMAEVAGVDRDTITAWSRRSTQLRDWAAHNLQRRGRSPLTAAQLAAAQKATRPAKPEELAWAQLVAQWRADARGLRLDRAAFDAARAARRAAARTPFDTRAHPGARPSRSTRPRSPAPTSIEILGAQLPVDTERSPRELLEAAVDEVAVRLTAPRAAHQREGHERFTLDAHPGRGGRGARSGRRARRPRHAVDQRRRHRAPVAGSEARRARTSAARRGWCSRCPRRPARARPPRCAPCAPPRTAASTARCWCWRRPAKPSTSPSAKAPATTATPSPKPCSLLRDNQLTLGPHTLVVVDEAAMVGTDDLRQLLTATTQAGAKTVLVGDAHQLAPVKARGGMFAQLCTDLPWTQHLSEVWRMRDPDERAASLALRDGGPAPVRRAIGWYRTHDRLHCGDPIAMAADALAAYRADIAAGKDALLVCDTTEMADALNHRLHHDTIAADARHRRPAARGHRIARRRPHPDPPQRPHHPDCATPTTPTRRAQPGAQRQPLARRRHQPRQQSHRRPNASTTTPGARSPATTSASTSPTATPSPCTPPKASPPTPPTPSSAKTPPAHCCTSP